MGSDPLSTQNFKRKLTAVFSADVAGYSRLMGDNEAETVKTLEAYKQVMFSLIKQHRGRVVDSPGDNLLAEFASVVDAVESAVEIQWQLKAKNAQLSESRRMEFRIGINLGDVIEEGETYELRVESVGNKGDGIAKVDKYLIFIPSTVKGEVVKAKIKKISGTLAFAEVVERKSKAS